MFIMKNNQTKLAYDSLQKKIIYKKRKFALDLAEQINSTSFFAHKSYLLAEKVNASYWNVFKIFAAVSLCIFASAPFTLIPQHNAINF